MLYTKQEPLMVKSVLRFELTTEKSSGNNTKTQTMLSQIVNLKDHQRGLNNYVNA